MISLWQVCGALLFLSWALLISPGTAEGAALIDGRILKILESEYPELFSSDFDMVKRYSSYAFGLGKRKPNFSFGLGKRNQLKEMPDIPLNPGYEEGQHVRNRRSASDTSLTNPYEIDQTESENKRNGGIYGFGIGKRFKEDFPQDLYPYTSQNFMDYLAKRYLLSRSPYYNYKALPASVRPENVGDKRGKSSYSFGLGKRGYSFGLGKRDYSFGLGKRLTNKMDLKDNADGYQESLNKRTPNYHFGLGKRSYDFGLGKKNSEPF